MVASVTTPLIGPSLTQVWKPPVGVTPGVAGDKTAPFALSTRVMTNAAVRGLAQFVRVGAAGVAAAAAASVTSGVTTGAAGSGNSWTNDTGVDLVEGDYAFLTTAEITT